LWLYDKKNEIVFKTGKKNPEETISSGQTFFDLEALIFICGIAP